MQLQPLVDALKEEMLRRSVVHADETPIAMLKPRNGRTHRAYLWAYAQGAFEDMKAVFSRLLRNTRGRACQSLPWGVEGQPRL